MITNGYLLSRDVLTILKIKVDFIQITIDGGPKVHDLKRPLADGSKTFEKFYIIYITDSIYYQKFLYE